MSVTPRPAYCMSDRQPTSNDAADKRRGDGGGGGGEGDTRMDMVQQATARFCPSAERITYACIMLPGPGPKECPPTVAAIQVGGRYNYAGHCACLGWEARPFGKQSTNHLPYYVYESTFFVPVTSPGPMLHHCHYVPRTGAFPTESFYTWQERRNIAFSMSSSLQPE